MNEYVLSVADDATSVAGSDSLRADYSIMTQGITLQL
jgi:hypothetical protein